MKFPNIKNFYAWPLAIHMLIIFLICVLIFYFAYGWDITRLQSKLANSKEKESDLKQQLELVIRKQILTSKEISHYFKLEKLLVDWQKQLISYPQLPELLNDILKMGTSNQIYFSQFNPGEETKETIYLKLPIKVIAVGSYHQLANFISQIANMPAIVVINDFTISNENKNDVLGSKLAEEANTRHFLTAELLLDIYRLPDKAKLPMVTPPEPPKKPGATQKETPPAQVVAPQKSATVPEKSL